MRRILPALLLLLLLTGATPLPQRFLLLYSNNVHGETEPCG